MSFSGYRLFSKPEVTLFSPEIAIKFHFRLGKVYIYIRIGQGTSKKSIHRKPEMTLSEFSTKSNPVMFGTVGFVSKICLQNYIGKWNSHYSFSHYRPFF